ncbi:MAG: tRNA lysidine(34) synthetase TilS [candidate division Zixibacteria bacterium RBG_16_40_9]|nr:MAG: tRNA lysidine(34) synthetase TilS [candidate division Zixibacteria bacterium RBG_16_40_9]
MKENGLVFKVKETIKKYQLLKSNDKILVAVSGGPDSVALLSILFDLRYKFNWDIETAHINHKLRGKGSDKDEEFVKTLACQLGLQFYLKSLDTKKFASRKKLSLEDAARQIRYEFLEKTAQNIKADKIALGHTQNDQAETVLMRLFRGSGSLGLSGIPIQRGEFIRPLLEVSREEILKYLKQKKLSCRTDKSNLTAQFLRNRIRQKLLPLLQKEFNPEIVSTLSRTATILNEIEQFLEKETEKIYKKVAGQKKGLILLDLKRFLSSGKLIQRNLLRHSWTRLTNDIYPLDFKQVERVLDLTESGKVGKRVNLKNNYWAELNSKHLVIFKEQLKKYKIPVKFPGEFKLNGHNLKAQIVDREKLPEKVRTKSENYAYLDWEKLKAPLRLRSFLPGDRFRPLGMKGSKKVSDFFVDAKIPRHKREEIFLLTSKGKIAWIVGERISEDFKVDRKTRKVVALQFSNAR